MTDSRFSPRHKAPSRQRSALAVGLVIVLGVVVWVVTALTVYVVLVYTST